MKLRSGRLIVRRKNIYLSTEVWVDILCFPWITRWRLAQMVDKIGNRWFGEQLQFYLHEWGKHTLRELYFTHQGLMKWQNGQYHPLEYPQTEMPENIKFSKYFQIDGYYRIDPKDVADQLGNARTILGHLLPLIDEIHTVYTDDQMLPMVKTSMLDKFHQIKVLDIMFTCFVQSAMQLIMEWLTTSSNEPKLLYLYCANDEIDQQVLEAIRKQFIEATNPTTFAVIFRYFQTPFDLNCENGIGEKLCGLQNENTGKFMVFRHQANVEAGDQLHKWLDANADKKGVQKPKQHISLCKPTIGDGPIFALPDLDEAENEEEEDDDEKPSTSKKRRICK